MTSTSAFICFANDKKHSLLLKQVQNVALEIVNTPLGLVAINNSDAYIIWAKAEIIFLHHVRNDLKQTDSLVNQYSNRGMFSLRVFIIDGSKLTKVGYISVYDWVVIWVNQWKGKLNIVGSFCIRLS